MGSFCGKTLTVLAARGYFVEKLLLLLLALLVLACNPDSAIRIEPARNAEATKSAVRRTAVAKRDRAVEATREKAREDRAAINRAQATWVAKSSEATAIANMNRQLERWEDLLLGLIDTCIDALSGRRPVIELQVNRSLYSKLSALANDWEFKRYWHPSDVEIVEAAFRLMRDGRPRFSRHPAEYCYALRGLGE